MKIHICFLCRCQHFLCHHCQSPPPTTIIVFIIDQWLQTIPSPATTIIITTTTTTTTTTSEIFFYSSSCASWKPTQHQLLWIFLLGFPCWYSLTGIELDWIPSPFPWPWRWCWWRQGSLQHTPGSRCVSNKKATIM